MFPAHNVVARFYAAFSILRGYAKYVLWVETLQECTVHSFPAGRDGCMKTAPVHQKCPVPAALTENENKRL